MYSEPDCQRTHARTRTLHKRPIHGHTLAQQLLAVHALYCCLRLLLSLILNQRITLHTTQQETPEATRTTAAATVISTTNTREHANVTRTHLDEATTPVKVHVDVLHGAKLSERVKNVVFLGLLMDTRNEQDPALHRCRCRHTRHRARRNNTQSSGAPAAATHHNNNNSATRCIENNRQPRRQWRQ